MSNGMDGKNVQRVALAIAEMAIREAGDAPQAIIALTGALVEIAARSSNVPEVVRITKGALDRWEELLAKV